MLFKVWFKICVFRLHFALIVASLREGLRLPHFSLEKDGVVRALIEIGLCCGLYTKNVGLMTHLFSGCECAYGIENTMFTLTPVRWFTCSLFRWLNHGLTHSYSLTHSLAHSLTHLPTYPLTHSLTHSLTHPHAHKPQSLPGGWALSPTAFKSSLACSHPHSFAHSLVHLLTHTHTHTSHPHSHTHIHFRACRAAGHCPPRHSNYPSPTCLLSPSLSIAH